MCVSISLRTTAVNTSVLDQLCNVTQPLFIDYNDYTYGSDYSSTYLSNSTFLLLGKNSTELVRNVKVDKFYRDATI